MFHFFACIFASEIDVLNWSTENLRSVLIKSAKCTEIKHFAISARYMNEEVFIQKKFIVFTPKFTKNKLALNS